MNSQAQAKEKIKKNIVHFFRVSTSIAKIIGGFGTVVALAAVLIQRSQYIIDNRPYLTVERLGDNTQILPKNYDQAESIIYKLSLPIKNVGRVPSKFQVETPRFHHDTQILKSFFDKKALEADLKVEEITTLSGVLFPGQEKLVELLVYLPKELKKLSPLPIFDISEIRFSVKINYGNYKSDQLHYYTLVNSKVVYDDDPSTNNTRQTDWHIVDIQ